MISGNLVGRRDRRLDVDAEPDRGQPDRHRQVGHGRPRQLERGRPDRGRLRQHGRRNDVGGAERDLGQPVGHPARRVDGDANLIEGNDVGTDFTGTTPLGNEINGIILSNNASDNYDRRHGQRDRGTRSRSTWRRECCVQSGTGDSILSNSIFSNGHLGIDLAAAGRPSQRGDAQRARRARRAERSPELPGDDRRRRRHQRLGPGQLEQPPEYAVPDPVLQQHGARSIRLWPGPNPARIAVDHHRLRTVRPWSQLTHRRRSRQRLGQRHRDQRDHRRHVGILARISLRSR